MISPRTITTAFALSLVASSTAAADDGEAGASGSISMSSKDGVKTESSKSKKSKKSDQSGKPFLKQYAPERGMMEVGVFGGVMFISNQHELYDPNNAWVRYKRIAPDIGLRFAYYPLKFLGIEAEGAVIPTKTETDQGAVLYGIRGHVIGQLPWRVAPFALIGLGALGASSDTLGADIDPALHFGGGVKFFINHYLALRLDVRDNVSAAVQVENGRTNYIEILLGLSATLGRKKEEAKKLIDSDATASGIRARARRPRRRTSARTSRGRSRTRAARSSTPTATASGIRARARPPRRRTRARTSRARRRRRAARSRTPTATASPTRARASRPRTSASNPLIR